jgi:dynein light chain roadblock-type
MSGTSSPGQPQQQQQQENENANMVELQETVSRLSSHKGVEAVLILNKQGDILVQSGSAADMQQAIFTRQLMKLADQHLAGLLPGDEVSFLQIRSKQHQEIMIAPHGDFILAVLKR